MSFTYTREDGPPDGHDHLPGATTPPTARNWHGQITGTASAGTGATISSVSVAVEDTTASRCGGTARSFSASSETWNAANGTTTWLLGLAAKRPHLRSYLQRHRRGDRQPRQHRDQLDGELHLPVNAHLAHGRGHLPGQQHRLRHQLDRLDHRHRLVDTRGRRIASVSVAVEDMTTSTWWNGTSFSAGKQSFVSRKRHDELAVRLGGEEPHLR